MNDVLDLLYGFTVEHRQMSYLQHAEYTCVCSLHDRLQKELEQALPYEQLDTFHKFCDALNERFSYEQEAIFCAAWSIFREL